MMYDTKIANDMNIDGNDPRIPRIFESQLSPICEYMFKCAMCVFLLKIKAFVAI